MFGPDAPANTTDYSYADLYYFTKAGVSTNTAKYGAGQWNIDTHEYNADGNEVWSLTVANRAAGLTAGWTSAQTRAFLGTTTAYSADGTRMQSVTEPTGWVALENGTPIWGSKQTVSIYDDEATAAEMPGKPSGWTSSDLPRHNVLIKQTSQVIDWAANTYDPHTSWYRYNPVVTGDGDGWTLGTATRTSTSLGSGWSTKISRYDTQGRLVETRTPQGVATNDSAGSDARSTLTAYYTADTSSSDPACRNHPEWVDAVCSQGPAGGNAPTVTTGGFDYLGSPTRVVQMAGTSKHITVTAYDNVGRKTSSIPSSVNAPSGEVAAKPTYYTYFPYTGALWAVSDSSPLTNDAAFMSRDSWGRVIAQTDGNGNSATTTYNAAGQVATFNDGKGTYSYTYDGTDTDGKTERRGLVTKVDTGLPGNAGIVKAAYGVDGQETKLVYPNGVYRAKGYDTTGQASNLAYYQADGTPITSWGLTRDVDGRVRAEAGPLGQKAYDYDGRGRLVMVQDAPWGIGCTTRTYGFSLDSNRSSLVSFGPGSGGACTTATTPTVRWGAFNGDDQKVDPSCESKLVRELGGRTDGALRPLRSYPHEVA